MNFYLKYYIFVYFFLQNFNYLTKNHSKFFKIFQHCSDFFIFIDPKETNYEKIIYNSQEVQLINKWQKNFFNNFLNYRYSKYIFDINTHSIKDYFFDINIQMINYFHSNDLSCKNYINFLKKFFIMINKDNYGKFFIKYLGFCFILCLFTMDHWSYKKVNEFLNLFFLSNGNNYYLILKFFDGLTNGLLYIKNQKKLLKILEFLWLNPNVKLKKFLFNYILYSLAVKRQQLLIVEWLSNFNIKIQYTWNYLYVMDDDNTINFLKNYQKLYFLFLFCAKQHSLYST